MNINKRVLIRALQGNFLLEYVVSLMKYIIFTSYLYWRGDLLTPYWTLVDPCWTLAGPPHTVRVGRYAVPYSTQYRKNHVFHQENHGFHQEIRYNRNGYFLYAFLYIKYSKPNDSTIPGVNTECYVTALLFMSAARMSLCQVPPISPPTRNYRIAKAGLTQPCPPRGL